ncbi:MAG: hypothetical protein ACK5Q8_14100 [Phycisphaerales bacterium]|jgi:hypothetical protein|nr:hypothetical protein [Actinomycetota bacterium]
MMPLEDSRVLLLAIAMALALPIILLACRPAKRRLRNPVRSPWNGPPVSQTLPDRTSDHPAFLPWPEGAKRRELDRRLNALAERADAAERRIEALERRVDDLMWGGERGVRE